MPLEFLAAEVARPVAARLPLTLEFSGPLVAPRTAVVRAKAAGTLLSLSVAEGSRVKAGQVIGVIDLAELQSRAADRAALVESAQAALIEAERQNTANVGLAAQNFISPTALQTSQARLDAARAAAQVGAGAARLDAGRHSRRDACRADLGHRRQAPCRARARRSAPSSRSSPSSTCPRSSSPARSARTRCRCSSPARSAAVRIEGHGSDVAGRIDRIAPAAEAGTRAIGVVVALDNKGERFRAGQYAQARVELADPAERLTVPSGAVGQASGQDFVWAIEKGALVRRIVVTGRRDAAAGRVEVVKGLGRRRADPRRPLRQPQGGRAGQGRRAAQQREPGRGPSSAPAGSSPSASASAAPLSRS